MKRSVRIILSVLSGVILSLAWLGFPGWILFVAFLPLLLLDDFFVDQKDNYRSVSFWGHTFLSFLLWNILATWWIMHATLEGAVMAIFLNSFFMSLVWWLAHIARRKFSFRLGYIALIVFYLAFESLHYMWEIEWPWLTLGNGFANDVKIIQWFEFTGVFGGSLWVLIINIFLFNILKQIINSKLNRSFYYKSLSLFLLIAIPVGISMIMYSGYQEKEDPNEIIIIQPNIDPYNESHNATFANEVLNKFVRLATSEISPETDFVVGPETIFEQYWNEENLKNNFQYRKLTGFLKDYPEVEMIFGASTIKYYHPGENIPVSANKRDINGQKVTYDVFNSALFAGQNGESQIYHKSILVPGVEKMPYIKYLQFLKSFIIDLGGATGTLGTQPEPSNFKTSNGTVIAPAICYESIFGEYMTEFVKKGAEYIFIITNDGWWKNTPGYKQHLSFARLRAIETRRSIARSANTGLSCFINQRGEVFQKTKWWEDAVIKGTINANDEITFYVRYGDYITRIATFVSVLLILFMIVEKLRGTKKI